MMRPDLDLLATPFQGADGLLPAATVKSLQRYLLETLQRKALELDARVLFQKPFHHHYLETVMVVCVDHQLRPVREKQLVLLLVGNVWLKLCLV
jgi:hypothetical protein